MRKTYKFELPQSKEVEKIKVRVENGQMLVDVEFKEKVEPKDGDFLFCEGLGVFICRNSPYKGTIRAYVATNIKGDIITQPELFPLKPYWCHLIQCRFASPDEKAEFLERLENELRKRWDPETKTLEPIRWRANRNEYYYAMTPEFTVARYLEEYSIFDEGRYNAGNYFETPKEVQPYAEKVKEIFKS